MALPIFADQLDTAFVMAATQAHIDDPSTLPDEAGSGAMDIKADFIAFSADDNENLRAIPLWASAVSPSVPGKASGSATLRVTQASGAASAATVLNGFRRQNMGLVMLYGEGGEQIRVKVVLMKSTRNFGGGGDGSGDEVSLAWNIQSLFDIEHVTS